MTAVRDLALRFDVSEMTVRRDLEALAADGLLERVRGGAVVIGNEEPFAQTRVERQAEKARIARAAADMVTDGQTVIIDVGTTTLQLAGELRKRDLTVITTNLAVYDELFDAPGITLVLTGGQVRRNYRSLVGFMAEEALRNMSADLAFLGASGIDSRLRIRDSTLIEVPIKRAMLSAAHRSVLLLDSAKFGTGGFDICGAADLDTVVTDEGAPEPMVSQLKDLGVNVVVA